MKIGRDVTIESKRIIFLLHTIDKESKRESILEAAKQRLDTVAKTLFKNIAYELDNQDAYQYHRAYRPGVEEYIEALTFYKYLQNSDIQDWTKLEETLTYDRTLDTSDSTDPIITKPMCVLVTPSDYILGIADLTGELMRKCISNLAISDIASCFETCDFVRNVYIGFLSCSSPMCGKEINRKLFTLRQSLTKIENVCYNIKVRGSEIPKHMLADIANASTEDYGNEEDEGYQIY